MLSLFLLSCLVWLLAIVCVILSWFLVLIAALELLVVEGWVSVGHVKEVRINIGMGALSAKLVRLLRLVLGG